LIFIGDWELTDFPSDLFDRICYHFGHFSCLANYSKSSIVAFTDVSNIQ